VTELLALALWPLLAAGPAAPPPGPPPGARPVPRSAVAAAMLSERGYDLRVTTNQSRLQARVLLRLARESLREGPATAVLFIDHEDWFQAYLQATGLRAEQAPLSVGLSRLHQYDILEDARPGAVVARVEAGPAPTQALNVRWRSRLGTPRYSYRDSQSRPELELSFEGTVSYRLLEWDGPVSFDEIEGVSGRPATGALSLLFRLIGQARAAWSRSLVSSDGWQVLMGQGRKGPFTRTGTVTVRPDGLVEQGLPPGRGDLVALERRLKELPAVTYRPWRRDE
jgi:hypothetical protein